MRPEDIATEAERIAEAERQKYCPDSGKTQKIQINFETILSCLRKNQVGDAELFKILYRNELIFDHGGQRWYRWQGHYWALDRVEDSLAAVESITYLYQSALDRVSRQINEQSEGKPGKELSDTEKLLRRRLYELRSHSRATDILKMARAGADGLSTPGDDWDQNPLVIGVENGVIELQNGHFRAGKQSDMIRTSCPVSWRDLDQPCPNWIKFLTDIFDSNTELIEFFQRLIGYSITALCSEHIFAIFFGDGRNGKSTVVEVIKAVIGDYGKSIQAETLMQTRHENSAGSARSDLMALIGKRFIWASESGQNRRLNTSVVKQLTGADTIAARAVYGREEVNFIPTHKIFLLSNFKPKIPPEDFAAWQRIVLIPFSLRFVSDPKEKNERAKDPNIKKKLLEEAPGILAWMVAGSKSWFRHGLNIPEIVRGAIERYHGENDSLSDFISACCIEKTGAEIQARSLYDAYTTYCTESGQNPMNINRFTAGMLMKFDRYDKSHKKFYIGLTLTSD